MDTGRPPVRADVADNQSDLPSGSVECVPAIKVMTLHTPNELAIVHHMHAIALRTYQSLSSVPRPGTSPRTLDLEDQVRPTRLSSTHAPAYYVYVAIFQLSWSTTLDVSIEQSLRTELPRLSVQPSIHRRCSEKIGEGEKAQNFNSRS